MKKASIDESELHWSSLLRLCCESASERPGDHSCKDGLRIGLEHWVHYARLLLYRMDLPDDRRRWLGACRAPTAFLRLSRDNCEIFMTVRKARLMADDIGTLKCSFVQNKSAPLLFQTLNFGRPNGGPPLIMDLHFAPGLPLVRTSNYEGSSRVHDRKQAGHEGFRDAMQLEWRSYLRATFDLGLEHIRFSLRPKAEVLV